MELKKEILKNKATLFKVLETLVSYNSVENKDEEGTPFGIEVKKCLEKALNYGEEFGCKVKNLDNYCGYAEIGEKDEILGIACHLDIVPAGNGWNTDPFTLTEKDGYLYGRGVSDDKGAASAALIALKIINDLNLNINGKKVRLIFGCNEETGSLCMKHYNEIEGPFDYGFTPDSEFPCVNGEKGHIKGTFKCNDTAIIDIKGGSAFNALCDKCTIKLPKNSYNKERFENYLKNNSLKIERIEEENIEILTVIGKSAHASMPELGLNAITYAMHALKDSNFDDQFVKSYCNLFDLECLGTAAGLNCSDDYGNLTMVNGVIEQNNKVISGTIDIRVPVSLKTTDIVNKLLNTNNLLTITVDSYENALFYDENSHLVKSLMTAYRNVTKDKKAKPSISGGGTYAKSLENCVAFGCEFPNNENNIHDANERVKIEELFLQVELYINAILELVK